MDGGMENSKEHQREWEGEGTGNWERRELLKGESVSSDKWCRESREERDREEGGEEAFALHIVVLLCWVHIYL